MDAPVKVHDQICWKDGDLGRASPSFMWRVATLSIEGNGIMQALDEVLESSRPGLESDGLQNWTWIKFLDGNHQGNLKPTSERSWSQFGRGIIATEAFYRGEWETMLKWGLSESCIDLDLLIKAQPDIVLSSCATARSHVGLEDYRWALERFLKKPVELIDTGWERASDAIECVQKLSKQLKKEKMGNNLVTSWKRQLACAASVAMGRDKVEVVCLDSIKPCTEARPYVLDLIVHMGGINAFCGVWNLTADLTLASVLESTPQLLILYEAGQSIPELKTCLADFENELKLAKTRGIFVAILDGVKLMGSAEASIVRLAEVLVEIMHPEAQPFGHESSLWDWHFPFAPE